MKNTITNVVLEGVDPKDHPDYCDAYIASADHNGTALTDKELDELNEDADFVHECVINNL